MDTERIIQSVLLKVESCYNEEQQNLHSLSAHAETEGEIRDAAGQLVEHILQCIFDTLNELLPGINIISKVGYTDMLSKTIDYRGRHIVFDTIQVDRHVWAKGKRICFIENKTYLDSCYYDRALSDFRKIAQSLKQHQQDPSQYKYIVFAGQDAANEKTLFAYEADFWHETKHLTADPDGLETKIFFFLKGKRSSAKPLYEYKHELDKSSLSAFIKYMLGLLEQV